MDSKDFVYTWNEPWTYSPGGLGNEMDARMYFWNNSQESILKKLQTDLADGWEPITVIGPASFKIRQFEVKAKKNLSDFFILDTSSCRDRTWYEALEFRVALIKRD